MRNLNSYSGDDFQFYKDMIDSKKKSPTDPDYKTRVTLLNTCVAKKYIEYRACFDGNNFSLLSAHPFNNNTKTDLLKLYSFKSKIIQNLKIKITTTETKRIINTCQNCTISEINSFDHLIPKEEFSEYAVNPKNLFPSCTKCNSYKNTKWKDQNSNPLFLNLYLDILPEQQYLFADIKIEDNVITVEFSLKNPNRIDENTFNLILSHYTELHLLERFTENIDSVITPLENTINKFRQKLPLNEITDLIIETSEVNKLSFGHNYWKSILEIALVTSEEFLQRFV
ncbi:hypothetical protein KO529_09955 [Arenibacter algicola]|uniref:HNH endonuclease n=1 Tax=Arenibacter algicola TaxID=616991 RepID=UPI001C0708F1|nr:HNH endonuclease [Arenibacter algicola]MBU2905107.1 hypothetical protein [Arenibacter algicola]